MITRCKQCNKPIALHKTAWTCGPMFCSRNCGIDWAKTLYEPYEYVDNKDLTSKAKRYFDDVAEEITREDYGATVEYIRVYNKEHDITTVFEEARESENRICQTCIGWYYGNDELPIEEVIKSGMTAIFVD